MKRILGILAGATLPVIALATVVVLAQEPQRAPEAGITVKQTREFHGPDGPPPPPLGDFVFVTADMNFSGPVVKGAPYSAQAVTESIQTLSDGNRIVNKFNSQVYRDSEGRTRREQTLMGIGGIGVGEEPLKTIFISDPVSGVSYSLDSKSHVAHKTSVMKMEWKTKDGPGVRVAPGEEGTHFEFKVEPGPGMAAGTVMVGPPMAGRQMKGAPGEPSDQLVVTSTAGVASNYVFARRKTGTESNEVKENLGKQIVEGVEAEGTRTTITIPAGEIGNERPIEIVSERWYSPELQVVVMTRNSDPRSGETTYKLTNISRTEPAKSLFEVPSDYTLKEGKVPFGPVPRIRKLQSPE
jgi:hypothetical protein